MATDNFKQVIFNAGEQGVIADFNSLQRQARMAINEMLLLPRLTNYTQRGVNTTNSRDPELADFVSANVPTEMAFCPFVHAAYIAPGAGARELTLGSDGPLVQVFDESFNDPSEDPTILVYWATRADFATLTTSIGDATNPRIDLVEMKLEEVDGGNEDRVFTIESVRASLDLGGETTNVDTVIRCPIGGRGGNNVSIAFAATGTGVGSLTRNGNAFTFEYESGVTTVQDFEDAITALAVGDQLIEIESAGTSANVFADPDDTITATHLAGGVDPIVASSNVPKVKQVVATFQINEGTPAATPTYPTPTAGFVPVAAVRVPATHNAVHSRTNLRDMRWPMGGVRAYDVLPHQMRKNTGGTTWTIGNSQDVLIGANGGAGFATADIPNVGLGRIVGVGVFGDAGSGIECHLIKVTLDGGGVGITSTEIVSCPNLGTWLVDQGGTVPQWAQEDAIRFMDNLDTEDETRAAGTTVGAPIWTNGERCGAVMRQNKNYGTFDAADGGPSRVALRMEASSNATAIYMVRFYVAHGMG